MKKEFKFKLLEAGIGVEFGEEKYLVTYEEAELSWDDGKKWCEERGGKLPTIEQLITLYEHSDEINVALEKAGKESVGGWIWSDREHSSNERLAWCVYMDYGYTDCYYKDYTFYVRAVSAFHIQ